MRNILLTYGKGEIKQDWMSFFDDYYYIKIDSKNIDQEQLKDFFKEKLIIAESTDNLFIINNDLNININDNEEVFQYIIDNILNKNKFCYLWNYMQDCQRLKLYEIYDQYNFYKTSSASEIYAVAASFKTWYSILINKTKNIPLYLRLQDNIKDNVIFVWPPLFNFPLDKIENNFLLASFCRENFNAQPLTPYNNNVAKIFFILTISIVATFFYFFWKKIPRPRYFYLKHLPKKF